MKKIKGILIVMAAVAVAWQASAQADVHFSQFTAVPIEINPASAGMFRGDLRVISNYRQQWSTITSPFTTINGSMDFRVWRDAVTSMDFFSVGASFYTDEAGDSNFKTDQGNLTLAYAYPLDGQGNMYISLGFQGGYVQRSISYGGLYWHNQWTGKTFNTSIPSGETEFGSSATFFDFSSGIQFFYTPNELQKYTGGITMAHVQKPELNFNKEVDELYRKIRMNVAMEVGAPNSNVTFSPALLYMQQASNRNLVAGCDIKLLFKERAQITGYINEMSGSLGAYYRVGDAFIPTLRLNLGGLSIGMSYDLNISDLKVASASQGGPEVMLMYRAGFKARKGKASSFTVRFL